ncbi:hypothetical protein D3C84_1305170 [compost metagenome]
MTASSCSVIGTELKLKLNATELKAMNKAANKAVYTMLRMDPFLMMHLPMYKDIC